MKPKGLDAIYRRWIQTQPSATSGTFDEYVDGSGRSVAAHYRHAGNAGVGMKPMFSCLPLSQREHLRQHALGYTGLESYEWWENKVRTHQARFERETGWTIPQEYRL